MFRSVLAIVAVAGMTSAAFAQNVAAIDPGVTIAELEGVMDQCERVAAEPEIADTTGGICITATRSFLAGIITPEQEDTVQELVVRLLELSQLFPDCNDFDNEIAAAIRAAAERIREGSELREDFLAAAQTIEDCEITNLAAIPASAITLG